MINIKQHLYDHCQQYISKRIHAIQEALENDQASANEETKSSAGDKYETGRAMLQLEIEKNHAQLTGALILKRKLDQINPNQQSHIIRAGSLVICDQGNFFLTISVGQLKVDEKVYAVLSPESPVGAKLMGLKAGESFTFMDRTYQIQQVL